MRRSVALDGGVGNRRYVSASGYFPIIKHSFISNGCLNSKELTGLRNISNLSMQNTDYNFYLHTAIFLTTNLRKYTKASF